MAINWWMSSSLITGLHTKKSPSESWLQLLRLTKETIWQSVGTQKALKCWTYFTTHNQHKETFWNRRRLVHVTNSFSLENKLWKVVRYKSFNKRGQQRNSWYESFTRGRQRGLARLDSPEDPEALWPKHRLIGLHTETPQWHFWCHSLINPGKNFQIADWFSYCDMIFEMSGLFFCH